MPSLKPNGKRLNGTGSGWISKAGRLSVYLRDGFRCVYCERDLSAAPAREVSLDHVTPQCQGGTHEPGNLVLSCVRCNSRRQHRSVRDFAGAEGVRRVRNATRRKPNLSLARAILRGDAPAVEARPCAHLATR